MELPGFHASIIKHCFLESLCYDSWLNNSCKTIIYYKVPLAGIEPTMLPTGKDSLHR